MAYSLRLPAALDALARARADAMGISINALLCVAVDAYVRPTGQAFQPDQRPAPGLGQAPETAFTNAKTNGQPPVQTQAPTPQAGQLDVTPTSQQGFTRAQRVEFTQRMRQERKALKANKG